MEFAKRTAILLVFALLTVAPAGSETTAPPTAPATTSAAATPAIESASCLAKITASPSVMPLSIDTIQYLLESPSVAGKAAQEVLGIKRGNYMMLTCNGMDAQTCLELGVVNEVVEKGKVLDRAWELARDIMKKSRSCRRLTHYMCVRPWKSLIERDFRIQVLSEMYSFNLSESAHDFEYIDYEDQKET